MVEMRRWPNRDPMGKDGGINLYGYVANNPVNAIDPLGLWQFTISGEFILGGSITFGNNGGQTNIGFTAGFGVGFSGNFNPDDNPGSFANGLSAKIDVGFEGSYGVPEAPEGEYNGEYSTEVDNYYHKAVLGGGLSKYYLGGVSGETGRYSKWNLPTESLQEGKISSRNDWSYGAGVGIVAGFKWGTSCQRILF